jgi:hypothetical protein
LKAMHADPKKFDWLAATIDLSNSGSADMRLCSVEWLPGSAPYQSIILEMETGLKLVWSKGSLPKQIIVRADSALADWGLTQPLGLEVRTSAGVFQAVLQPPPQLTADIETQLENNVRWLEELCAITHSWMSGGLGGGLPIDWRVDPLIDPDPGDRWAELVELEVSGLAKDVSLEISLAGNGSKLVAAATSDGVARGQFLRQAGARPIAQLLLPIRRRADFHAIDEGSVGVFCQRLEFIASAHLPTTTITPTGIPSASGGRFAFVDPNGVLLSDLTRNGGLSVVSYWGVPNVSAVVPIGNGFVAYGVGGIVRLSLQRPGAVERLHDAPVIDASACPQYLAAITEGGVDIRSTSGATLHTLQAEHVVAILAAGSHLFILCQRGLSVFDMTRPSRPSELARDNSLFGSKLYRSQFDGGVYLQERHGFALLARSGNLISTPVRSTHAPWSIDLARSGSALLKLLPGGGASVFRLGARERAYPQTRNPVRMQE